MSVVDDRIHGGETPRVEGLWQTPDPALSADRGVRAPRAGTPAFPDPGPNPSPSPNPSSSPSPRPVRGSESVFTRPGGGDQLWQARIDLVVSSGLSGDAARRSHQDAKRAQSRASFDALLQRCEDELKPVLECSADMLHQRGLEARVTETLRDEPARVPRSFDLALGIDRFGDRGPAKLTITATEGTDFVRTKVVVGPSRIGGEATEHVGTTTAGDLCDALVGGLVATLVEQMFNR
jgi:hypothetical protein